MRPADRHQIESLLDAEIGRGYWDPARDLEDIALVAAELDRIVGVATASVEQKGNDVSEGHIRLVAVERSSRRRGIATRLVAEISTLCTAQGAASLVAYAWVHGRGGVAPLSGALQGAGFAFERRIEGFYGHAGTSACPACGQSPCVCPADVYRRGAPAPVG